jgi:hypothetical protein
MTKNEAAANWEKIQIGWWYTPCCEHELTRVASVEELNAMVTDLKDPKIVLPPEFGVWPTREEAIAEILQRRQ